MLKPAIDAVRTWGTMVRFSHSVFALPFALSGAALAALEVGITARQVAWIVVAMVCARNAAMGFNRLADHHLDARNPRTAGRELPRGRLSRGAVWLFTIALCAGFVLAAWRLNPLCGALAPLALAMVLGYSYTKRFTWASHLVLGLALAIAPVGGWLAVTGRFALLPWLLAAGVVAWVAGFDVIYACQDVEVDRRLGLFSMPARFGVARALTVSRSLHAAALVALAAVGVVGGLHPVYWLGYAIIAALVIRQHVLVREDDLSRLGAAFNLNGIVSVVYFGTVLAAVLARRVGVA